MSGIPVDTLVDIDGPYDRFSSLPYFRPSEFIQHDDDPFELCSMQGNHSMKGKQTIDLGVELGLALEKSIKLRSMSHQQDLPAGTPVNINQTDLGILINLDDSPDKKNLTTGQAKNTSEHQNVKDSVFTHTASNPFELAWDVIEQEAQNLADHIQYDKEKTISPRKMVDLAMRLSPDSMLLSPRNDARDQEILIHSSPELEMKKTPRFTRASQARGRMSIGSSPVVPRSYTTPLRTRPSLASVNPSPLRKPIKEPTPTPTKTVPHKATFKTPLLRSTSASHPTNHVAPPKPPILKLGAMKAVHQQPCPPSATAIKAPPRQPGIAVLPIRRSVTPAAQTSSLPFQSKLRAPLSRSESDALHQLPSNKPSEFQRQGSIRLGPRRASVSVPPSSVSGSSGNNPHSNRLPALCRPQAKGRENVVP